MIIIVVYGSLVLVITWWPWIMGEGEGLYRYEGTGAGSVHRVSVGPWCSGGRVF